MKNLQYFLFFLFIFCSKDIDDPNGETTNPVEEPKPEETIVVSSEASSNYTGSFIQFFANTAVDPPLTYAFDDVATTKIIYRTENEKGEDRNASGVLLFPKTAPYKGIVSLQHGTIQNDSGAPSNSYLGNNEYTLGVILASTGYFVLMPDYLGYVESNDQLHPYEHRTSLAITAYDFLNAGIAYLSKQKIEITKPLYLIGYSEGGGATLALHQYIESKGTFEIKKSYAGAGNYDKTETAKTIFQTQDSLPFMGVYLWVLDFYNRHYNSLNRSWSTYLNEPFATRIDEISPINSYVPDSIISLNPQELIKSEFVDGVLSGNDTAFLAVLKDNDLNDWSPKAPIDLYHGTEDNFVFPFNSINAKEQLNQNGGDVSYYPIEGKNHLEAALPFYLSVIKALNSNTP